MRLLVPSLSLLLLAGCEPDWAGRLYDHSGNPVAGSAVRLSAVDDGGSELDVLASAVTNADGTFFFHVSPDTNASVVVTGFPPTGSIRGFYAGSSREIPVHPISEGMVSLIKDITATPGGRSAADFTPWELRGIANAAFAADRSGLDMTDAYSVKEFLRGSVGRAIAMAAGGRIAARESSFLDGSPTAGEALFEADVSVCASGRPVFILSSGGFRFDLTRNGMLCGGSRDDLTPMLTSQSLELLVPGRVFHEHGGEFFPLTGEPTADMSGERELILGPYRVETIPSSETGSTEADTISIARKIFVPEEGGFARYLEVIANDGDEDRAISIRIKTFLTTGTDSALLTRDSATQPRSDRFVAAYDPYRDRPTVGFVFQDGLGPVTEVSELAVPGSAGGEVFEVSYLWEDLPIPSGSTVTLLHFVAYTTSRSEEEVKDLLKSLAEAPDLSGLSTAELAGLVNFTPGSGSVSGEAGAVIGRAFLRGENLTTEEGLTVRARNDGSFFIPLQTASGDRIHITASDGLDTAVTVP